MPSIDLAKDPKKYTTNSEKNTRLASLLDGYRNSWTIVRIDRIDEGAEFPGGSHGWKFHRV
jgi:hypothetical protein